MKCWACGESAHGDPNNRKIRSQHCSAWETMCSKCNKKGHLPKLCSKCSHCSSWGHKNKGFKGCPQNKDNLAEESKGEAGFVGDYMSQLCSSEICRSRNGKYVLSNHIFDARRGWIQTLSKPHPMIWAHASVGVKDHEKFGSPISKTSIPKPLDAMMVTDSGCQSTVIPINTVYSMGLKKSDLLPVKMTMTGAGNDDLGIVGAAVLDITTKDETGEILFTKQFCYV